LIARITTDLHETVAAPGLPHPAGRRWRPWLPIALIAAGAAVVAIAGSLWLFPLLTDNSDEGAYLAQASALRSGHVLPVAPSEFPDAFRPAFTAHRDGHFVYKYAPVHPAILAGVRTLLWSERVALGLVAGGCAFLLYAFARAVGASTRAALFGAVALVLSPLFLLQSTTFLPYLSNLTLLLAFGVLLVRGASRGSVGSLLAAGLFVSLAFWSRPFDALLFGAPIAVWAVHRTWRSTGRRAALRVSTALVAGAVPGLVGFFAYNALATGDPFELPFRLLDQSDTLGLGRHRLLENAPYVDFTPRLAAEATYRNILLLVSWSFGSMVLVALGVFGLVRERALVGRWLLVVMAIVWPAGYFFFWGSYNYIFLWDGGRFLGPYYYLPVLVPLTIAAGIGFDRLLRVSKPLSVLAVALAAALSVPVVVRTVSDNRDRTETREIVMGAVRDATEGDRAFLILPAVWGPVLQHPMSFLRNSEGLDGRRVYALDIGPETVEVADRYPDRRAFVMSLPDGFRRADHGGTRVWVDHAALRAGREIELSVTAPPQLVDAGLVLRVGRGLASIDVPFDRNDRADVRVWPAGRDAVVVSDGTYTTQVAVPLSPRKSGPGGEGQLDVSLMHASLIDTSDVMTRRVYVQTSDSRVRAVWPGAISKSAIGPDTHIGWSSKTVVP
jgi:hypothetical protein